MCTDLSCALYFSAPLSGDLGASAGHHTGGPPSSSGRVCIPKKVQVAQVSVKLYLQENKMLAEDQIIILLLIVLILHDIKH